MSQTLSHKSVTNWLAQCKRRMQWPLDRSEEVGLSAFEYAWKGFNVLYSDFKGKTDKLKMYACIDAYLDSAAYIGSSGETLKMLTDLLLSDHFPGNNPTDAELYLRLVNAHYLRA